ncbi:MAG: hypothetical protein CMP10_08175 [Zetaproteobacteria bacterium]|nr:hypothetical protein [Pseudobdellovibrionaceae bacterium]
MLNCALSSCLFSLSLARSPIFVTGNIGNSMAAQTEGRNRSSARGKQKQSSEDSRELLMRVARHFFAEKGYEGTTIRDIVEKAGLNVSLISYHFGGKEGLYRRILEKVQSQSLQITEETLKSPGSKSEFEIRLLLYVERILAEYADDLDMFVIISREIENFSPMFQELLQPVFSETIVGLGMFLREAQKKGFLRKDLSSSLLANLLHGTIGHMMRSEKSRRKLLGVSVHDEEERARIAHHIVALFTGNIKGNGLPVNTESGETIQ